MEEIIEIIISQDGSEIQLDAKGFTGKKCSITLDTLGKAIGNISKMTVKSEFYDKENDLDVVITTK